MLRFVFIYDARFADALYSGQDFTQDLEKTKTQVLYDKKRFK